MGKIVAVDVGGTLIRCATYDPISIEPFKHHRISTQAPGETPFDRLTTAIAAVWPDEPADAISVAVAGPLDPVSGVVLSSPNIPGWDNFPLVERLAARFKVPVFAGNDANLAALGEWRYGSGQGYHDLLYLTISTGIGGGVISHDQLITGHSGLATELGHVTVLPDGPPCSCGQRGHLESISSGPGIVRFVSEQLERGQKSVLKTAGLTAKRIAEAAQQGDVLARQAFARAGEYLGQAMADYLHIFNPAIVILGGGVSRSGALLFEPMEDSLRRHIMDVNYLKDLVITQAKLDDNVGLLGALVQAQMRLASNEN